MFELFTQGYSFLNLLSVIAFFTTVALFFCGIPICRQIWKRRDTDEISGAPFFMGILGGCCWMTYGWLKNDQTVLWVTGCQVVFYSTYTIFYWIMTKNKLWISLKIGTVLSLCVTLWLMVHFFGMKVFHPLGIICMTLNTADFAAPLAGLRVVIRRGATSTLPLPLCIANFMVSSEWFIYGLLVKDFYLITPNGIGSVFALAQLFLFVVLPRKPGQQSPIAYLWHKVRGDAEPDLVDPTADMIISELGMNGDEKKLTRAKRWSKKMLTNVSTVAEELENVISRGVIHDQYGYKQKMSDGDDTSTEQTLDERSENDKNRSNLPASWIRQNENHRSLRVQQTKNINSLPDRPKRIKKSHSLPQISKETEN